MLIPKAVLKSMGTAAAAENTRYAINGIRIERTPEACWAIATDGRRLLIAEWEDESVSKEYPEVGLDCKRVDGFGATIPLDSWKALAKIVPNNRHKPILENVRIQEPGAESTVKAAALSQGGVQSQEHNLDDKVFPDYRVIVPDYTDTDTVEIGLNPILLAELCKAMSTMTDGGTVIKVTIPIERCSERPVLIEAEGGGVKATGIICALKLDNRPHIKPFKKERKKLV